MYAGATSLAVTRVGSGGEMKIGNVTLQVLPGDITTETTDAIVNSTNNRLDLSIGKCF